MGCGDSAESKPSGQQPLQAAVLFEQYGLKNLITPDVRFSNDLEKEIFMALNVCRFNSQLFVDVVKDIRANNKDPLIQNAQYTDRLIKLLEQNERYPQITYDIAATDAVIANNKAMTAPGLMNIIDGGNKAALCRLVCCDVPAEEFTMKGYQSTSGRQRTG